MSSASKGLHFDTFTPKLNFAPSAPPCNNSNPLRSSQIDHKEDNCLGLLYEKADIPNLPSDYNFKGFTEGAIACACILSGCDYLKNLPQMGIVKARHIVEKSFRPWLEAKDR